MESFDAKGLYKGPPLWPNRPVDLSTRPSYTAKILRNGRELLFDFSHLPDSETSDVATLIEQWCAQHESVAKCCSSFVARLPGGEIKGVLPRLKPLTH